MKTFEQALRGATEELKTAGVPEPDLNAWYLLSYAVALSRIDSEADEVDEAARARELHELSPDRSWYIMHSADEPGKDILENYERVLSYRKKGCPLEYITHFTEFMGLPFYVDCATLIPRQDTECLVSEALDCMKNMESDGADVLDLCTGSGCIAVSLAAVGNCRSVTATDISAEALRIARINAGLNNVSVSLFQGDLFDAMEKDKPDEPGFDLITCNPPYIRRDVIPELMREVREYEPVTALDGGTDGLDFHRKILSEIADYLRPDGYLIFEIGYDQGADITALMCEAGLKDVQVKKDLAGNDRVAVGVRKGSRNV